MSTSEEYWTIQAGETEIGVKVEIDDKTRRAVVIKLFVDERMVSCIVNKENKR